MHEEALPLHPVGHEFRDFSLNNLGDALFYRFNQRSDIDDIDRAMSFLREVLTLRPPGNPYRDNTLDNLAAALQKRDKPLTLLDIMENDTPHAKVACHTAVAMRRHPTKLSTSQLVSRFRVSRASSARCGWSMMLSQNALSKLSMRSHSKILRMVVYEGGPGTQPRDSFREEQSTT